MHSIKYLFIFVVLLLLTACKKEEIEEPTINHASKNGVLVLNEGLFQHNNSSLTWVNLENMEVSNDIFMNINERPLGDTGNDMVLYGGKIYIAVTGSSTLEVIDKNTFKSIKQIPFNYNNQAQEPRKIAAHDGQVFVSSFDGYVTAIDTNNFKINKRIKVGRNPEGICVSNTSLFVANSGGLDFQNPDSTVFEIDLNTLTVVDTFIVGDNPGAIIADDFDNVYVVKRGDYAGDPSELIKINTQNETVSNLGLTVSTISKKDNSLFLSYYNHSTSSSAVSIFDCTSQTISESNFINNQDITTLYGFTPIKSTEFIALDAMKFTNTGYLRFFNSSGSLTNSVQVGLNPNSIIYYE